MPHRKEGKKMQHKQIPRALGFTLVELLVVISIIALLIAITVPMVGRATESARRAQARTEVASITTAIRAYYNEYGRFPHGSGLVDYRYTGENLELINVLRAVEGRGNAAHVNNRRRIVFLEVSQNSLSEDGDFLDPWSRWRVGVYEVACDTDFNNEIRVPGFPEPILNQLAIAWSLGPSHLSGNPQPVRSWE
jgi:prepilin-type N-terminal cleavage/methylation domain-containing protein